MLHSSLVLMIDNSYGIIPLRKDGAGNWEVLIIQHRTGGWWGFPKGHAEGNETLLQAAIRELAEETTLAIVTLLVDEPLTESYHYMRGEISMEKKVTYFIATVSGEVNIQEEELLASKWIPLKDAPLHITYPESRSLCHKVMSLLAT